MLVKKGSEGMKKILLFVFTLFIFTIFVACNALTVDTNVIFHDDLLEAIIRHEINMPEGIIKKSDLLLVETLDLSNEGIKDLRGIEELKNLRELNLRNNHLVQSTTELIGSLVLLEYLNLRETGITDISFLNKLPLLTYLNIHSNPIETIKPIQKLHNLEQLIMRNVDVGDELKYLQKLPNIKSLNARNCNITDLKGLTKLMDSGALQGEGAVVDLRGNPAMLMYSEVSPLVPYWQNISKRDPHNLNLSALPPLFSHESGFYEDDFILTITPNSPNSTIYYTIDGSEPYRNNIDGSVYKIQQKYPDGPIEYRSMKTKLYTKPLLITNRTSEPNKLTDINSTYSQIYHEPDFLITKGTVIRAKAYDSEGDYSKTVTNTYFVGSDFETNYRLPVISIVTSEKNLFDFYEGIYVPGKIYNEWRIANPHRASSGATPANYLKRGIEWERPAHVTFFEADGSIGFTQDMGIRIHGGYSRAYQRKSLRLYPRTLYASENTIRYDVFNGLVARGDGNHIIDNFNRLNLRNSGNHAHSTLYRDALMQYLVSHLSIDTQAYRPAVHFINGEFWGIINIRERHDDYYIYSHYGVEREDVVMLENNAKVALGTEEDAEDFLNLRKYADENDLSQDKHYQYVASKIDIENFISYNVAHIYFNNTDWPGNNVKLWRKRTNDIMENSPYGHDGKWRFLVFDTDHGFVTYSNNTLENATTAEQTNWANPTWSTLLLRNLLQNEEFKHQLVNTFADNINTSFSPSRVNNKIDEMHEEIIYALDEHLRRWGTNSFDGNYMKTFGRNRPAVMQNHIMDYFKLKGMSNLTVKTNGLIGGYVKLNSIDIHVDTPGIQNSSYWTGQYFKDIPITLTAIPSPGYIFDGWGGDVTSTNPTIYLTLKRDTEVVANFVIIGDS